MNTVAKKAYSITEFCASNGIGRTTYYEIKKHGQGPREMIVGARKLISEEAAADWRRERETASAPSAVA
jgi:hypothetical protein